MPIEKAVHFLNIDLEIAGGFDPKPLLDALGGDLFCLHGHERVQVDGLDCLVLELSGRAPLDLTSTLDRLLEWVHRLPRPARREWSRASRRRFDVGLAAGQQPHCSIWTLSPEQLAALAKLRAEVVISVYGADQRSPSRAAPLPRKRPRRGGKADRRARG